MQHGGEVAVRDIKPQGWDSAVEQHHRATCEKGSAAERWQVTLVHLVHHEAQADGSFGLARGEGDLEDRSLGLGEAVDVDSAHLEIQRPESLDVEQRQGLGYFLYGSQRRTAPAEKRTATAL